MYRVRNHSGVYNVVCSAVYTFSYLVTVDACYLEIKSNQAKLRKIHDATTYQKQKKQGHQEIFIMSKHDCIMRQHGLPKISL